MSHPRALWAAAAVLLALAACSGDGADPEPTLTLAEDGMRLSSSAFAHEGLIPERYTCDGADVSPPLTLEDVPEVTVSLVLIVEDPDAPGRTWDHWVAYDIPPTTGHMPEGVTSLGIAGRNTSGSTGYGGPCPPSGTHRYYFKVLALDTELGLQPGATKSEVLDAAAGHVLAEATLMGRYSR